jgi:hypothetical protein
MGGIVEVFTNPREIIEEFRKRRRRQFIYSGCGVALAMLSRVAVSQLGKKAPWLTDEVFVGVFMALVATFLIVSFLNWRCPACDKYIGRSLFPNFCQKCGARFEEE